MTWFGKTTLYITPDELHGALRRLGHGGDSDEAIVTLYAETLARMAEVGGVFVVKSEPRVVRIEKVEG